MIDPETEQKLMHAFDKAFEEGKVRVSPLPGITAALPTTDHWILYAQATMSVRLDKKTLEVIND